jgi:hypothetical protein
MLDQLYWYGKLYYRYLQCYHVATIKVQKHVCICLPICISYK